MVCWLLSKDGWYVDWRCRLFIITKAMSTTEKETAYTAFFHCKPSTNLGVSNRTSHSPNSTIGTNVQTRAWAVRKMHSRIRLIKNALFSLNFGLKRIRLSVTEKASGWANAFKNLTYRKCIECFLWISGGNAFELALPKSSGWLLIRQKYVHST